VFKTKIQPLLLIKQSQLTLGTENNKSEGVSCRMSTPP
jgi:hypothetical protein